MQSKRRRLLRSIGGLALGNALAAWMRIVLAAEWNKPAFDARKMSDSLSAIGCDKLIESGDIALNAPEIAENGAVVPVEISSSIEGTETIYVFAEKNPQPLVASFDFSAGTEPFVETRIKMAETAILRVVVKASGKFYTASREVKVTIGGCGG
jgi:sulfur-oxidizing protein SoxY